VTVVADVLAAPLTPNATLRWQVVRPMLAELHPGTVLEIGCGQGAFGARIAATTSYTGLELDGRSFATARPRIEARGGRAVHGSWDQLDEAASFDVVCAFEVLEHLADDVAALTEWCQRIRPGGSLVLSVPADPERFGPMDRLVGHYRRYSADTMAAALEAAGLRPVRMVHYGWPLAYALEAGRNLIARRRGADGAVAAHPHGHGHGHGAGDEAEMAERTSGSGRLFQPGALAGLAVSLGVAPFAAAQRLHTDRGTGLVATARRPTDH
jgi:SAM-dependent methyltransferase